MSNIHGLHSKPKSDAKDGEEEFSVGGKTSSTAVIRPNNGAGRDGGQSISDLMNHARQSQVGGPPQGGTALNIIVYQNGFKLGEKGEFRDISEPQNQAFLEQIKQGNVPDELQEELRELLGPAATNVGIGLENKMSEVFVPPKKPFDFSKSEGKSLGASSSTSQAVDTSQLSAREFIPNADEPTTTLQIVLHNRKKVRATFNHSTTVGQLYEHVMHISGQSSNFNLLGGFPPKPLQDNSATIKEAGLVGSSVQQRLT